MNFKDLDWPDGADNTPGTAQYFLQAKVSEIETIPEPVQPDSIGDGEFADLATVNDNFVMKPGKSFKQIYATLESGSVTSNAQGELDGMSYLNEFKFFHPGSREEALGYAQYCKNGSFIFIVPELDGNKRIVGHKYYPAKMSAAEVTTGEKPADRKGFLFTFKSSYKGPPPIFKGEIEVSGVGSEVDANSDGKQDVYWVD